MRKKAGTLIGLYNECLASAERPEFGAIATREIRTAISTHGSQTAAAKKMGVPLRSLQDLIKRYPHLKESK